MRRLGSLGHHPHWGFRSSRRYAGCMPRDYTGPRDTNDFDNLDPDQAVATMAAYKLLGEAFEDASEEDMLGRGWLLEVPLELVRALAQRRVKAEREVLAAIKLARLQGESDAGIAEAAGLDLDELTARFGSV